jgi:ribulose-5-phosphate 4-epimerase/fuculose-1-phosphate aldolase
MQKALEQLITHSLSVGATIDFVQGGGGNTSLKLSDSLMAIKTSGIRLSDMSISSGYTLVDYPTICAHLSPTLSETEYSSLLTTNIINEDGFASGKPSMETGFHALLGPSVLHTHSVYCNVLTCTENGEKLIGEIFSGSDFEWAWIPYYNPGLKLTLAIQAHLSHAPNTQVFFLQNHGIIVSGNTAEESTQLHAKVNETLKHSLNLLEMSLTYELESTSDELFSMTTHFNHDLDYVLHHVLFPDQAIYLNDGFDIHSGSTTFKASHKKAAYMAETFLAYEYILTQMAIRDLTPRFIDLSQINEVAALPSEKYRKGLLK